MGKRVCKVEEGKWDGRGEPCLGEERDREQGGYSLGFRWKQGNATEPFSMRAYSRHQVGGGHRGAGSVKYPRSGMSPQAVSLNNPG